MAAPEPEKRRKPMASFNCGPGPAGVMLKPLVGYNDHDPTKMRLPAYSMGGKPGLQGLTSSGPGPAYAIAKGFTAKGQDIGRSFTILGRGVIKEKGEVGPGPAAYYPAINVNRNKPPEYSLRMRTRLIEKGNASPGPIYLLPPAIGPKIPDKMAAAEISIKGRARDDAKASMSPGPIYDIGRPDLIKPKGAEVVLKGRWVGAKGDVIQASPASYNIDQGNCCSAKIWRIAPSYTMGSRHSEYAGTLLTDCDKAGA